TSGTAARPTRPMARAWPRRWGSSPEPAGVPQADGPLSRAVGVETSSGGGSGCHAGHQFVHGFDHRRHGHYRRLDRASGQPACAYQSLDAGLYLGAAERLLQEVVGAVTLHVELLGGLRVAADHHDRDMRGARVVAQRAQHRETVDARQHDVEEDQLGQLGLRQLQRLLAVGSLLHRVAVLLQHAAQHRADRGRIVHHQHARTQRRLPPAIRPLRRRVGAAQPPLEESHAVHREAPRSHPIKLKIADLARPVVAADGGAEPRRNLRCTAQCPCGRCRSRLMPVLQPAQFPARVLVRALPRRLHADQPALFALRLARQPAGLALAIQRLRRAGRTALVRQRQHLDLQPLLAPADLQHVARVQRLRRLAAPTVDVDLAAGYRLFGEAAGLEEARGPQPHVGAHFGRNIVVLVVHHWHYRRVSRGASSWITSSSIPGHSASASSVASWPATRPRAGSTAAPSIDRRNCIRKSATPRSRPNCAPGITSRRAASIAAATALTSCRPGPQSMPWPNALASGAESLLTHAPSNQLPSGTVSNDSTMPAPSTVFASSGSNSYSSARMVAETIGAIAACNTPATSVSPPTPVATPSAQHNAGASSSFQPSPQATALY